MKNKRTWCVYIHTNTVNGKKYVGITSQIPEKRWLNGHGYGDTHFGRAIQKYGWDSFQHEIVRTGMTLDEASDMEEKLVLELGTLNRDVGYNTRTGGVHGGCKSSDEARAKMSLAKRGSNHPNYGKHLPTLTRQKIAEGLVGNKNAYGVARSEETRKLMSKSKCKPVCMHDDEGNVVKVFESALTAGEELGINRKNISLCCLGKRKHAGGYSWSFM